MRDRNKMEEKEEEVKTISSLNHQGKCEIKCWIKWRSLEP